MSKARNEAIALVDDPVHGALARLILHRDPNPAGP